LEQSFKNFIIHGGNKRAFDKVQALGKRVYYDEDLVEGILLTGASGSGKTHLMKALAGVLELSDHDYVFGSGSDFKKYCFDFKSEGKDDVSVFSRNSKYDMSRAGKILIIDDFQSVITKNSQFIHSKLFEMLRQAEDCKSFIVISSDTSLDDFDFAKRISDRLMGENFVNVHISQSNDSETSSKIILQLFKDVNNYIDKTTFDRIFDLGLSIRQLIRVFKDIKSDYFSYKRKLTPSDVNYILMPICKKMINHDLKKIANKILKKNGLLVEHLKKRDSRTMRVKKQIIKECVEGGFSVNEIATFMNFTIQNIYRTMRTMENKEK